MWAALVKVKWPPYPGDNNLFKNSHHNFSREAVYIENFISSNIAIPTVILMNKSD